MSTPSTTGTDLALAILGPLRVTSADAELVLGGRQQRAILARLLVAGDGGASIDQLADMLWGGHPPDGAVTTIQTYVFHLRKLLEPERRRGAPAQILTTEHGRYRLTVPLETVDAVLFERATDGGEALVAAGAADAAAVDLRRGLALWRGEVLADLADFEFVAPVAARLNERRLVAQETLIDCELALGRPHAAVRESEAPAIQYPLREQLQQRRMLSLYRVGRQSDALACYEDLRHRLREELGIDPSAPVQRLHQQILTHDPSLDWQPQSHGEQSTRETTGEREFRTPADRGAEVPPLRRTATRIRVASAAVVMLIAIALTSDILATRGDRTRTNMVANSVVALAADGSVAAAVPVGARPVAVASAANALWVANFDDRSVTRVDLATRRVVRRVSVPGAPSALAATPNAVWVTDDSGHISTIDPAYNQVASTRQLSVLPVSFNRAPAPVLAAFGFVWIVDPDGHVSRVPLGSSRQSKGSVDVGNAPSAIAAGAGSVWVTNAADGTVTRIDPATFLPTTFPVGHDPVAVAVNADGVWITNAGDRSLVRVDPATDAVDLTKPVGDDPTAVLAMPHAVWVAGGRDGTVMRFAARSGDLTATSRLGGTPNALTAAGGRVWVAVAPATPAPPTAGGVGRFTISSDFQSSDFQSLDPALPTVLGISYATCANLVTYPDKPAPEGSRVVPEVAQAIPTPTDGATTYRFAIRPGYRFSPPSNEAVTAATFKSTIERVTNPRMRSQFAGPLSGIVGYHAYVTGKSRGISGIVARGNALTITLSRPDGGFLAHLAGGAACAVPRNTPVVRGGLTNVPSAGPYYIASYTPRQQLVLKRNPNYHGDRPHVLAQMVVAIGIDTPRALKDIEAGRADYSLDGVGLAAGSRLQAQYGPASKAAKAGRQRYFVSAANGTRFLHMNMSRPLFAQLRLRRAVNYAIDRAAVVAQGQRFPESNPFSTGSATDAYLPASTVGATDAHVFPIDGPDLRRAKQIAGPVHATAIMYTPNIAPWQQEAEIVRRDLQPLGITVVVREFPFDEFYTRISRRGEPFDLAVSGWAFSSTDPAEVFSIFDGNTIRRIDNANLSYFDNPAFDRGLAAAAKLSGVARYRAYGRLELELERNYVPAAPLANNVSRDFFSARIGCQVYQPVFGMDLAALCLRS
jgi:ABC-type transport system substrate-binding protein/DNA-binding SARP family transcriptional activator